MKSTWPVMILLIAGCVRSPASSPGSPDMSPEILAEINRIRAIDNHAHPVRFVSAGEQDREFDALPVDNMEPASDPLQLRPDDAAVLEAWRALWNYPYNDTTQMHLREWNDQRKQEVARQKGDS